MKTDDIRSVWAYPSNATQDESLGPEYERANYERLRNGTGASSSSSPSSSSSSNNSSDCGSGASISSVLPYHWSKGGTKDSLGSKQLS